MAFHKDNARVRTKRTWLLVLSMLFAFGGFVPLMALVIETTLERRPLAALGALLYYAAVFGLGHAWERWWREEQGQLRADETGVWLDRRRVVTRRALRHGYPFRVEQRAFIRLGRVLRPVDVEVADAAEGEALLAAMLLDAAHSLGRYPMTRGTWRRAWVKAGAYMVLGVPLLFLTGKPSLVPTLLLGLLIAVVVDGANQYLRVSVGADGVCLRRAFARVRFVPFSAIDLARTEGRDIEIRIRGGKSIWMHHPAGGRWTGLLYRHRTLEGLKLVERITEQLAASHTRTDADALLFVRAGRRTEGWLRDVESAADDRASFRSPAVPPAVLWRIVEDSAAPASARAGAAVALRRALDREGRLRLGRVADACATPRLRVALESVACDECDEDLRLALNTLDDQEERGASG